MRMILDTVVVLLLLRIYFDENAYIRPTDALKNYIDSTLSRFQVYTLTHYITMQQLMQEKRA